MMSWGFTNNNVPYTLAIFAALRYAAKSISDRCLIAAAVQSPPINMGLDLHVTASSNQLRDFDMRAISALSTLYLNRSLVPNFPEAVHILFRLLRASPHVSQHSSLYATNIRQVVKHQPQERDSLECLRALPGFWPVCVARPHGFQPSRRHTPRGMAASLVIVV
jgi:hypothetical protein